MSVSMNKEEAIAFAKTEWWKGKTSYEICKKQFEIKLLAMPFALFHEAIEDCLGRPVWTHEFGSEKLEQEFNLKIPTPTVEEIFKPIVDRFGDRLIVIEVK